MSVRLYRDVSHEAMGYFQWLVYLLECHKHLLSFTEAILSSVPFHYPKAYLLAIWSYRSGALPTACRYQTSGADIWYRQDHVMLTATFQYAEFKPDVVKYFPWKNWLLLGAENELYYGYVKKGTRKCPTVQLKLSALCIIWVIASITGLVIQIALHRAAQKSSHICCK